MCIRDSYDTERWPEYRKVYRQVAGEVETVADIFTLQYILVAEREDQTRTGKAVSYTHLDVYKRQDETDVYHIGASLKDLGKKMFAFS